MILGVDHVQLAAPRGCEEAARAFFGGTLGLEEIAKPEPLAGRGGVWFRAGSQELHIGIEEPFAPAEKAHPAFAVRDEAALEELAGRLGEVRWDDSMAGVRRFYAFDPWGNRLEFLVS